MEKQPIQENENKFDYSKLEDIEKSIENKTKAYNELKIMLARLEGQIGLLQVIREQKSGA